MDPSTAYFAMWSDFRCGNYDEAIEHAEAILEWLGKGGYAVAGIPSLEAEATNVLDQAKRALAREIEARQPTEDHINVHNLRESIEAHERRLAAFLESSCPDGSDARAFMSGKLAGLRSARAQIAIEFPNYWRDPYDCCEQSC